jgi:hypothetical protein
VISISKDQAKAALSEASRLVAGRLPPSVEVGGSAIPSAALLQVVSMLLDELIDNIYSRQVNIEAGKDADITVRIS